MTEAKISGGVVHSMPTDLKQAIISHPRALDLWESLTPLGRNEFICWVENAKLENTRERRIRRTIEEMEEGRRRPCCWLGCIHRADKEISPSVKAVLEGRLGKAQSK